MKELFEGTIIYNVLEEFHGRKYHMNFKKLVCFIARNYYKEDFWSDKRNKYYTRIFDFEKNELYLINYRHRSVQKSKIVDYLDSNIYNIQIKNNQAYYEVEYDIDFGFKGKSKYTYKTDTGIYIDPKIAKYIRICSQIPIGNNEVSSNFKEEPNFRRSNKEYKLVSYIHKNLDPLKSELDKFNDIQVQSEPINRIVYATDWRKSKFKLMFEEGLIDFYQNILKYNLTETERKNIGPFSIIYMGSLENEEHDIIQKKLQKHLELFIKY